MCRARRLGCASVPRVLDAVRLNAKRDVGMTAGASALVAGIVELARLLA
jgi:hypothetical protein